MVAEHDLRTVGLPALELWDKLVGRPVDLDFHEDEETTGIAMRAGYLPVRRYTSRKHGVDLRWLASTFQREGVRPYYERSALQAADIYTKGFTVPAE